MDALRTFANRVIFNPLRAADWYILENTSVRKKLDAQTRVNIFLTIIGAAAAHRPVVRLVEKYTLEKIPAYFAFLLTSFVLSKILDLTNSERNKVSSPNQKKKNRLIQECLNSQNIPTSSLEQGGSVGLGIEEGLLPTLIQNSLRQSRTAFFIFKLAEEGKIHPTVMEKIKADWNRIPDAERNHIMDDIYQHDKDASFWNDTGWKNKKQLLWYMLHLLEENNIWM